jgi:hypothetical protein
VNAPTQDRLARAFEAYAAALERLPVSTQLDLRMQAAIEHELSHRRRPPPWRTHAKWALAASVALIASVTVILVRSSGFDRGVSGSTDAPSQTPPELAATDAMLIFPAGAVSLWPTEATVFRVRSTFGARNVEQQYWIDVRMANDGSMRIERVLSADGSELFARPEIGQ